MSRKRRFSGQKPEPRREQSAVYYTSDSDASAARYMRRMQSTYTWMFIEDICRVIPSGANDDNYREKVIVTTDEQDIISKIADGFDHGHDGYHRDIAYPLSEFLRLMMGELCFDGSASFEIARLFEPGKDTPTAFKLFHLNPSQLRRRNGQLIQVVPEDIAKQYKVSTAIHIPEENVVTFVLPRELRKQISMACNHLDLLSRRDSTELVMRAQREGLPYVFSEHNRAMHIAIAASTSSIGWNARGMFNDMTLTPFWLKRQVQFHRFEHKLRTALIDQINLFLARIGPRFGFSAQLRLEGFLTDQELTDIEGHIDRGDISMVAVVDLLSSRITTPKIAEA
jgi:hypothetical protein